MCSTYIKTMAVASPDGKITISMGSNTLSLDKYVAASSDVKSKQVFEFAGSLKEPSVVCMTRRLRACTRLELGAYAESFIMGMKVVLVEPESSKRTELPIEYVRWDIDGKTELVKGDDFPFFVPGTYSNCIKVVPTSDTLVNWGYVDLEVTFGYASKDVERMVMKHDAKVMSKRFVLESGRLRLIGDKDAAAGAEESKGGAEPVPAKPAAVDSVFKFELLKTVGRYSQGRISGSFGSTTVSNNAKMRMDVKGSVSYTKVMLDVVHGMLEGTPGRVVVNCVNGITEVCIGEDGVFTFRSNHSFNDFTAPVVETTHRFVFKGNEKAIGEFLRFMFPLE